MEQVQAHPDAQRGRGELAGKIDAFGWGSLFIWIGAAFLADVSWSSGILGVGLIVLAAQAVRMGCGLRLEWFSVALGTAMVAWAVLDRIGQPNGLSAIPHGFVPVLLIAVGLALILKAVLGRRDR